MAERKGFFEVFPGFECPGDTKELFAQVFVIAAVLVKSEKTLKIHIESKILIEKQDIYAVEDALSEFVSQGNLHVKIIEYYDLSNQYDISKLTNVYKDSLLFELQAESSVLYRLVKNAEWFIDANIITLTLDDTFLAKTRSADIKKYLEQVYRERFHYDIQVGFDFTEEQKDSIRRANEHKLYLEVHQIMEQVASNREQEEKTPEYAAKLPGAAKETKGEKQNTAPAGKPAMENRSKPKEGRWGASAYGRTRVADPEVIYGRNVEGKEYAISEITEGLGDIVVRGQIFEMEEKELRNGEKLLITFSITDFTDSIAGKILSPRKTGRC